MIDLFGKIALTSCAVYLLGSLANFFLENSPTAYEANATIGLTNIVVGAVCAFVWSIAKIWVEI